MKCGSEPEGKCGNEWELKWGSDPLGRCMLPLMCGIECDSKWGRLPLMCGRLPWGKLIDIWGMLPLMCGMLPLMWGIEWDSKWGSDPLGRWGMLPLICGIEWEAKCGSDSEPIAGRHDIPPGKWVIELGMKWDPLQEKSVGDGVTALPIALSEINIVARAKMRFMVQSRKLLKKRRGNGKRESGQREI